MVKYSREFREQGLLLPDEIGVKKVSEQLEINYYKIADIRKERSHKEKEERIAQDKRPLNKRELAMDTNKKRSVHCGS